LRRNGELFQKPRRLLRSLERKARFSDPPSASRETNASRAHARFRRKSECAATRNCVLALCTPICYPASFVRVHRRAQTRTDALLIAYYLPHVIITVSSVPRPRFALDETFKRADLLPARGEMRDSYAGHQITACKRVT